MAKKTTDYRLTPEQARLVEENHNLIYGFLHSRHLPIDEWYGAAAVGLCKAAASYNAARGAFSTYAYLYMRGELDREIRGQHALKRRAPASQSLDSLIKGPCSAEDPQDIVITAMQFEQAVNHAPARHAEMLRLRARGLRQREIAGRFGVSQYTVSLILSSLRAEVVAG